MAGNVAEVFSDVTQPPMFQYMVLQLTVSCVWFVIIISSGCFCSVVSGSNLVEAFRSFLISEIMNAIYDFLLKLFC